MKSFLLVALIIEIGFFMFTFVAPKEFSFSSFPSALPRVLSPRTVFFVPATPPSQATSKEFTPLFVNTPSFQKTPTDTFSSQAMPASLERKKQQTISAILSKPLTPPRLSLNGNTWTGEGLCYKQGPPNGTVGSNFPNVMCDGIYHSDSSSTGYGNLDVDSVCRTHKDCNKTGGCWPTDGGGCQPESCYGKCGDDGFIWDPETLMCGCNTGPLVNNKHAEKRCKDLGGEVVKDGGNTFCKMSGDTCPNNWSRHQKWAQTSAKTCTGSSSCGISPSCTTGSHAWGNTSQESCEYVTSTSQTSTSCVNTIASCSAPVGQIGCTTSSAKTCKDAGGEEVKDGDTTFCKFSQGACPTDWSPYGNWSQTSSKTCSGSSSCGVSLSCTTGSHSWENNDTQETCNYILNGARNGNTCTDTIDTCTAPITNVGCY